MTAYDRQFAANTHTSMVTAQAQLKTTTVDHAKTEAAIQALYMRILESEALILELEGKRQSQLQEQVSSMRKKAKRLEERSRELFDLLADLRRLALERGHRPPRFFSDMQASLDGLAAFYRLQAPTVESGNQAIRAFLSQLKSASPPPKRKVRLASGPIGPARGEAPIVHLRRPRSIFLRGRYQDRWRTPMADAAFALYVDDALQFEGKLRGFDGATFDEVGTFEYLEDEHGKLPHGQISVELKEDASLNQVTDALIKDLSPQLSKTYHALVASMSEYQELFDNYGYAGVFVSYKSGLEKGFLDTVSGIKELGTAEYWIAWGETISGVASATIDAAEYAYDGVKDGLETVYENRDNLVRAAWWAQKTSEAAQGMASAALTLRDTAAEAAQGLVFRIVLAGS